MPDDRSSGTDPTLTPSQLIGEAATSADTGRSDIGRRTLDGVAAALPPRYVLGARLGAGGMGEVVLARDEQIGRDVAIKRMRVEPTPALLARFLREAKIQGRLDHPAIVPVHELANDGDGKPFFVMKRLTGTTLAKILADRSLTRQKLLRAFADVCLAIEFAHRRGVVHRDLKPENIMLGDFGEVYVLDWGIAHVDSETDSLHDGSVTAGEAGDTEVGAILGTPGYIAPEVVRGDAIDARADVFALGAMLFEILTGQSLLPRGRGALDATTQPFEARPSVRVPECDCAPELEAIVVAATSPQRSDRPTARELGERVEHFLDGDRDLALRKSLAAGHVAAAHAALAGGDSPAERAIAMREAGRAIALDPHSGAAELVGRLMLEPPLETPPEVDEAIARSEEQTARDKLRMMTFSILAFVAMIPTCLIIGVRSSTALIWLGAAIAINVLHTWYVAQRSRPPMKSDMMRSAVIYAVLVFVIARDFSPFVMAPSIAAISIVMFLVDPRTPFSFIVITQGAAVILPWLAELVGLAPRTISSLPNGDIVFHAVAIYASMPATEIGLALFVIGTVIAAGVLARQLGMSQRAAMRTTELQAWHLRQLVKS
ncbi:MAG TPA: serine/threonine-protein kinase [Kofleriaceae bacterium]|nr:serine/threonine-protein kinase [Kofleriaceae bacterium]